jgi:hypothetical protein
VWRECGVVEGKGERWVDGRAREKGSGRGGALAVMTAAATVSHSAAWSAAATAERRVVHWVAQVPWMAAL